MTAPYPGDSFVSRSRHAAGEPPCFSGFVIPLSVIRLWGLVDPPACTAPG